MCRRNRRKVQRKISILVPFQARDPWRKAVWRWLRAYWVWNLLKRVDAEIIIGRDKKSKERWGKPKPLPFSKTAAVNDAFRRSHGDIIVIMDADAYFDASVIIHCARRLREQRRSGVRSWFIPYQVIYRLTKRATEDVLDSSPLDPLQFPTPPPPDEVEGTDGSGWGRNFGALCQIMPREAFELVSGMDERFRGWGGEDVSFLRALDTLWGKHKNTPNQILHMWHTKNIAGEWTDPKGKTWETRAWDNQIEGHANDSLSVHYNNASGDIDKMRKLVDEGKNDNNKRKG